MSRKDYESLRGLLLYHNTEADYEAVIKRFGMGAAKPADPA
jgi:hypothetical protein